MSTPVPVPSSHRWNAPESATTNNSKKGVGFDTGRPRMIDRIGTTICSKDDVTDSISQDLVNCLLALLPNGESKSKFHTHPPPVLSEMLLSSRLMDWVAELLRNDSLEDAVRRRGLYDDVLKLTTQLATHPSLKSTVYRERPAKEVRVTLWQLTRGEGKFKIVSGKTETMKSVANSVDELYIQSQALLKQGQKVSQAFKGETGSAQIYLCRQILALYKLLHPAGRETDLAQTWEQWQRNNALVEIPDRLIRESHKYVSEANRMKQIQPAFGRMRKIIAELANLKTSLPPGIFVRCGESENSLLKCLIVGPKGTPYEGGLFEFDILFPLEYPHMPPKMWLKTTGRGRVQFNPNLYADGKGRVYSMNRFPGLYGLMKY